MKADPYVMSPKRVAYICVLGRLWMPNVLAAHTYELSDYDIENIESFDRDGIESYLSSHAGDFSSIVDCRAVIGAQELPWKFLDSEVKFSDCVYVDVFE